MNKNARGLIVLHVVADRLSDYPESIEPQAVRAQDIENVTPLKEGAAKSLGIPSARARVTGAGRGRWVTETLDEVVALVNARVDGGGTA